MGSRCSVSYSAEAVDAALERGRPEFGELQPCFMWQPNLWRPAPPVALRLPGYLCSAMQTRQIHGPLPQNIRFYLTSVQCDAAAARHGRACSRGAGPPAHVSFNAALCFGAACACETQAPQRPGCPDCGQRPASPPLQQRHLRAPVCVNMARAVPRWLALFPPVCSSG